MDRVLPLTALKSGRFLYRRRTEQACKQMSSVIGCDEVVTGDIDRETRYNVSTKSSYREPGTAVEGEELYSKETLQSKAQTECFLSFERGVCKLKFMFPDTDLSNLKIKNQSTAEKRGHVVLECLDISAADLRVTSKFGTWDTMTGRMLVECSSPVRVCSVQETDKGTIYVGSFLNCCMVKATFGIEYLQEAREILHALKLSRNSDIRVYKEKQRRGEVTMTSAPGKIREGLPEWVNYIPYKWYSSRLRKTMEYVLVLYTVLSLLWAFWQLYKHVDFVKAYLRPLLDFLEYYITVMKSWLIWLDQLTTLMSQYWWRYMKPFYIIFVTAMAPVIKLFTPLKSVVNIMPHLLDPIFQFFNILYTFIRPLISPLYSVFDLVFVKGVKIIFEIVAQAVTAFANSAIVSIISEKCGQTFIVRLISEILHGKLDPIKAQVVVIRDLIFKSLKSIFIGARFITSRIYYMVVFVQRENQYAREELVVQKNTDKEGNSDDKKVSDDRDRDTSDRKVKMQ